jgi:hypothetical protein
VAAPPSAVRVTSDERPSDRATASATGTIGPAGLWPAPHREHMNQAAASPGGRSTALVRRALVGLGSVVLGAGLWLLPLRADASRAGLERPAQPCPSSTLFPDPACQTTTSQPTTTSAPTTEPPVTEPPPTDPPPTDPPVEEDQPTPPAEEEPTEPSDSQVAGGPLPTSANLLVEGDGTSGAQATTTTSTPDEGGSSTADDRRRLIWMIIAGLGAVALLVALLTWRYWLLTRPGLDLGEDDDPDGPGPSGPPPDEDRLAARGRSRRVATGAAGATTGAWAPPLGAPSSPPGPPGAGPGGPGGSGGPGGRPAFTGSGDGAMGAPPLAPSQGGGGWPDPRGVPEPAGHGRGGGSGPGGRSEGPGGGTHQGGPPPGGQAFVEPPPGGQAFVDAPGPSGGASPGRRSAAAPGRRSADRPGEPLNPSAYREVSGPPGGRPRPSEGLEPLPERGSGRGADRDPFGWDDPAPEPPGRGRGRRPPAPEDPSDEWPDPDPQGRH